MPGRTPPETGGCDNGDGSLRRLPDQEQDGRRRVVMAMAGRFDYDLERQAFSWEQAAATLPRLPTGGLNIAHVAVDAHLAAGHGDDVALICVDETGGTAQHTYADLSGATSRFAHLLRALGVGPGDRVMSLLGRQVEQYVTALGTLQEPQRLLAAVLLLRTRADPAAPLPRRGQGPGDHTEPLPPQGGGDARRPATPRARAPRRPSGGRDPRPGDRAGGRSRTTFEIPPTDPEDRALLHFTSGTTGTPKGAIHVHEAVLAHHVTGALRPRPAPRRRLLVHRRPGLGDRHVVRHHRAAHPRRHPGDVRR